MKKSIKKSIIENFDKITRKNQKIVLARNASFRNDLQEISMNWDHFRKIDHSFSHVIKVKCQPQIKSQAGVVGALLG